MRATEAVTKISSHVNAYEPMCNSKYNSVCATIASTTDTVEMGEPINKFDLAHSIRFSRHWQELDVAWIGLLHVCILPYTLQNLVTAIITGML